MRCLMFISLLIILVLPGKASAFDSPDWPDWGYPRDSQVLGAPDPTHYFGIRQRTLLLSSSLDASSLFTHFRDHWQALEPALPAATLQPYGDWQVGGQITDGFFCGVQVQELDGHTLAWLVQTELSESGQEESRATSDFKREFGTSSERILHQTYDDQIKHSEVEVIVSQSTLERIEAEMLALARTQDWSVRALTSGLAEMPDSKLFYLEKKGHKRFIVLMNRNGSSHIIRVTETL